MRNFNTISRCFRIAALGVSLSLLGFGAGLAPRMSHAQDVRTGDLICQVVIYCARGQGCDPEAGTEGEVLADFSSTDGWETARDGQTQRITVEHDLGRLVIEQRVEGTVISRNLGPNLEFTETRILGPEVSTSVGYCSRVNNESGDG